MSRRRRLLELLLAALAWAWTLYQIAPLILEGLTRLATLVRADPATGFSAGGPTYPNEWGVRLAPLTPAELEAALAAERTPSLPADESLGSPKPAVAAVPTAGRPPV